MQQLPENMQTNYVASQLTLTWELNIYLNSILFHIFNMFHELLQTVFYNLLSKSTLLMNSVQFCCNNIE